MEADYVAQIGEDTARQYETLGEAIENAASGETVYLLGDVTLDKTQTISKNLTLDLQEKTINGGIKIAGGQVTIENGTIESEKNGIEIANNTATVTLEDLSVSGEYGIYSSDVDILSISDCTIRGTASEAIFVFYDGDISIKNSTLTSDAEGEPALTTGWNFSGTLTLNDGNIVTGFVKIVGNSNHTPYTVIATGGCFDNGDELPFQHPNNDITELLKRLQLQGGSFKTDVSDLVSSGYQCIPADPVIDGYTYEVVQFDGVVTDFYSKDADGQRTYYETLEDAVAAGKSLDTTIYVTTDAEIANPELLNDVAFATLGSGKLSYTGTLEAFLNGGAILNNVFLNCSDANIVSAKTEDGKLTAGVVKDEDQWDDVIPSLHEEALICGDQTIGEIELKMEGNFTAQIGRVGYSRLGNALNDATDNDSENDQIKDEIILLEDANVSSLNYITAPYSSFTLDLNGYTIGGAGMSITLNSGTKAAADYANITLKNGMIAASENYGVSINGSLTGVQLELIDLNVSADSVVDGAAAYLASGDTIIRGGSYTGETGIQLCGGSLTIDGASVTSTGADRREDKDGHDGLISDGSAISVVNRDYPDGPPELMLNSGTFTSADGVDAVKAYTWDNQDNTSSEWEDVDQQMEISGGNFSSPVNLEYLSESLKFELYNPSKYGKAPYSYHMSVDDAKEQATEDSIISDLSDRTPATETYTLTLKYYDGKEQSIVGTTFILPTAPSRTGYTFRGWYDGDRKVTAEKITLDADLVLIAHWRDNATSSGGGAHHPDASDNSGSKRYDVSKPSDVENGSIKVSDSKAEKGETVTITVTPDEGYELDELIVTNEDGDEIDLKDKGDGKFTFEMPKSDVEIEVSFKLIGTGAENPFTDVSKSDYFYDAVLWAVDEDITAGVTENLFVPQGACTRAQMVTFLWRANGSPVANDTMNFTDVPADAYYADAVRWAVSEGITSGISETSFAPDMTVTRAQTVTFLHRAAGAPAVSGGSFADVDANAYYANAVAWAVSEDITSGTSASTFSPDAPCTRAQIVTFLYRAQ